MYERSWKIFVTIAIICLVSQHPKSYINIASEVGAVALDGKGHFGSKKYACCTKLSHIHRTAALAVWNDVCYCSHQDSYANTIWSNCNTITKREKLDRPEVRKLLLFYVFTFSRPEARKLLLFYVFTFSRPEVRKLLLFYVFTFSRP